MKGKCPGFDAVIIRQFLSFTNPPSWTPTLSSKLVSKMHT